MHVGKPIAVSKSQRKTWAKDGKAAPKSKKTAAGLHKLRGPLDKEVRKAASIALASMSKTFWMITRSLMNPVVHAEPNQEEQVQPLS